MNKKKTTRIVIEKKGSDYSSESDSNYTSNDSVYTTSDSNYTSNESSNKNGFVSIVNSGYKKSKYGSKQDHMTGYDMVHKLDNYVALNTLKEKKILRYMTPFKTWIRYFNIHNKKFRTGGLLLKVEYPDYIMLVNPKLNLTWSVQLNDHIIYVPDKEYPLNEQQKLTMRKKEKEMVIKREKEKELEVLKDHLFLLYKNGKLTLKKKV